MDVKEWGRIRMCVFRSAIERYSYLFAVLCIAASTSVFLLGRGYFAKGQWAILYLLIIGLVAGLSGVRPALLAAVLAFFCWNYFFLPSFHTFVVADPKDWLSLVAFLIVGIAVGLQTGRLKEREAEALAREREMALLNQFSTHLVSDTTVPDMADLLVREVKRTTGASRVTLFLSNESGRLEEVQAPSDACVPSHSVMDAAEWVHRESKAIGLPVPAAKSEIGGGGWPVSVSPESAGKSVGRHEVFIPLQSASRQEGVLYVAERADSKSYSVRNAQLLVAVANQSAAFLERKHLQSVAVKADALQEADKLKSTLVSSVSHELKTPLASVTATVSNLLEQDVDWDESHVHDELEAIQDDLQRLNNSIGALLDLSRLEAAAWEPKKDFYEFGEILGTAVSKIPQKQRGRISYDLPDDLPMINVDFPQWTRAIQNLLENALSYSSQTTSIRVGASNTQSEIRLWVEDQGPGIPLQDRERIFEKFYRGETSGKVPSGTGLGLAVTLEIVRFHGGRIWVEDVIPHGAKMVISLPKGDQ
jgi:two-component system, OmpR family, sensor histidine kinase KdpD